MVNKQLQRVKTISEFHKLRGLPKPENPLISLIDYPSIKHSHKNNGINWVFDFYSISLKRNINKKIRYGQQEYDFDEGIMFFIAPGQVFSIEVEENPVLKPSGWILLVHPDFLWGSSLAKAIKQYEYFSYSVNEALHLSEKEESAIINVMQSIRREYLSNIDKFTQGLMIAQLDIILKYAERFYSRQFITRKITNHKILNSLENILTEYFNSETLKEKGLPTVQYIADKLAISPGYLSSLSRVLTGQGVQQYIHDKLLDKAKEKLSTTELSVSEIAYELGFEHIQSFSKLFKAKTNLSPLEFRQSFN